MKKTFAIVLAMLFILSCTIVASATLVKDDSGKVTAWYPWVMDGNEIVQGSVTTSDEGIVKDLSSNWEIKAQDTQDKITKSYLSPSTVWTTDAAKDFELAFEVAGGSKVQIGFLHCVGDTLSGSLAVVKDDASDMGDYVQLYSSADGITWAVCSTTFTCESAADRQATLVSGMTGYDTVKTNVGDGVGAYSENYFIAEATVPSDAKYVKFVYPARARSNTWDPCIRDAVFTAPATDVSVVESAAESVAESTDESSTPSTGDFTYVYGLIAVAMIAASVLVLKKTRA